jgi:hypothetical protein
LNVSVECTHMEPIFKSHGELTGCVFVHSHFITIIIVDIYFF